jgi:hypothetical protein
VKDGSSRQTSTRRIIGHLGSRLLCKASTLSLALLAPLLNNQSSRRRKKGKKPKRMKNKNAKADN